MITILLAGITIIIGKIADISDIEEFTC